MRFFIVSSIYLYMVDWAMRLILTCCAHYVTVLSELVILFKDNWHISVFTFLYINTTLLFDKKRHHVLIIVTHILKWFPITTALNPRISWIQRLNFCYIQDKKKIVVSIVWYLYTWWILSETYHVYVLSNSVMQKS